MVELDVGGGSHKAMLFGTLGRNWRDSVSSLDGVAELGEIYGNVELI